MVCHCLSSPCFIKIVSSGGQINSIMMTFWAEEQEKTLVIRASVYKKERGRAKLGRFQTQSSGARLDKKTSEASPFRISSVPSAVWKTLSYFRLKKKCSTTTTSSLFLISLVESFSLQKERTKKNNERRTNIERNFELLDWLFE